MKRTFDRVNGKSTSDDMVTVEERELFEDLPEPPESWALWDFEDLLPIERFREKP